LSNVKNPSMSLSQGSKNEKVEQHVRNITYKFITLRFWVESGVNHLYESYFC